MTLMILFIATLALSLFAAARVKSVYNRFSRGSVLSGRTGAEAAALILNQAGIRDVEIAHHDEVLGDHYDPTAQAASVVIAELLRLLPGSPRGGGA